MAILKSKIENIKGRVTLAGIWSPIPELVGNPLANTFYSQLKLLNGRNGLVVTGWALNFLSEEKIQQVNIGLFEQDLQGNMHLVTSDYIDDPRTNGAGSVVVADFNKDGIDDVFLAAHNEKPWIPENSTAFISRPNGTYNKIVLDDHLEAHAATLADIDGLPTVFVNSYWGDANPYYQFIDNRFKKTELAQSLEDFGNHGYHYATVSGDALAIADFDGDRRLDIAQGDSTYGPGYPWSTTNVPPIIIYTLDDIVANIGTPLTRLDPYFNNKTEYPTEMTHTFRLWTDDFNQDGMPDLVAGASLWPKDFGMLQLLQNTSKDRKTQFEDRTGTLNRMYDVNSWEIDYSMQLLDIDGSGIKTYFSGGTPGKFDASKQSNYVLLNDGTGKLYHYLHNEFVELSKVAIELALEFNKKPGGYFVNADQFPRFIAFTTPDKEVNFVAQVGASQYINGAWTPVFLYFNFPLMLDPRKDYIENVTIIDRNHSTNIRTWAGDDVIYSDNSNSQARIDGGLGIDTIVYTGKYDAYKIRNNTEGEFEISIVGLSDTIKNIEQLKFDDRTVFLLTSSDFISGSNGGEFFLGNNLNNVVKGAGGNDVIEGGAGIDTAVYNGKLADYRIIFDGGNYAVSAKLGSEGNDTLSHVEKLQFSDINVNLTVQALAASAPVATVQRLMELYVAFFNRVPDADGMAYWISESKAGKSIYQIADIFYGAGLMFSDLTGFSANMTNIDFIHVVYRNVLGRTDGGDAEGVNYWNNELTSGKASRGSLVSTMLDAAHSFKGKADYGWVADLLDNKISVARTFSIDWGLGYTSPNDAILHGMEIAAAVTPTDISKAIALVGVNASDLQLF